MSKAQQLRDEITRLNDEVRGIFDQADADLAAGKSGELDAQTWEKVKTNNQEIERLEGQLATLVEQEQAKAQAASRNRLPTPGDGKGAAGRGERGRKTIGQSVLEDPEFRAWLAKTAPLVSGSSRIAVGSSPAAKIVGGMKALITGVSDTSAGALVMTEQLGLRDMGAWMRTLTIRDLITVGGTDTDLVEFVRITGVTNNAAPVAEATAASGGTGEKPESALAMEKVTAAVKTIAHWVPATRRALADAAQIRTIIDSFLRYGLDEELEDQVLNGDGTGENFTGILNTTGTTAQAYATNLLTTTRQARTKARVTGRVTPTAYVMNPNDWEDLDLLQDNEARYYFGGPSVLGNPRLWGLPVVESEAMPEGTAVVADWRMAALWDREDAQILVSDSHADFFIRNLVAILAELRAAFGVIRPAGFVEIDLTP